MHAVMGSNERARLKNGKGVPQILMTSALTEYGSNTLDLIPSPNRAESPLNGWFQKCLWELSPSSPIQCLQRCHGKCLRLLGGKQSFGGLGVTG